MTGNESIPPVPMGPEYPEAGKRVRLRIPPPDGRGTSLSVSGDASVDEHVAHVVGRVTGFLWAGHQYPLSQQEILEGWIREARPGFFKVDVSSHTIVCAAALGTEHVARLLGAVARSHTLARASADQALVSVIPILKAGLCEDVHYYVETPALPDVVVPDLVLDSLAFHRLLIFSPISPFEIVDPEEYVTGLVDGRDPIGILGFEPYIGWLLQETPESQRAAFVAQIGEDIRGMDSPRG